MRRTPLALALCACMASAGVARADDAAVQAHAFYERGSVAYARSDFATAAREYAAADALAPSPVALQAALDAVVRADDPVLGTTLVERARATPSTPALAAMLGAAERRFAHRTGRLQASCPSSPCHMTVDGQPAGADAPLLVRVGSHTVSLDAAGATTTQVVVVTPDQTLLVAPAARPPAPTPARALAPMPTPTPTPTPAPTPTPTPARALLLTTFAATALAGGLTIASAIDTASQHASFASSCTTGNAAPWCPSAASDGQSAQTRTNVLLGVTAGLVGLTAAAFVLLPWRGATASVGLGSVEVRAAF